MLKFTNEIHKNRIKEDQIVRKVFVIGLIKNGRIKIQIKLLQKLITKVLS